MTQVTLNKIGAGYRSSTALNNDFDIIEEGFERTLDRHGGPGNEMLGPLDMNSQRILNLPEPVEDGEPVRKIDLINQVLSELMVEEVKDIAAQEALTVTASKADIDGGNTTGSFTDNLQFETRTVAEELKDRLPVARFKVPSNSWADAIEEAMSVADSTGRATQLDLPGGNIILDRPIVVPFGRVVIRGQGIGSTVIYAAFGDQDVFRFEHPSGGSFLGSRVERLSISVLPENRPATSGYAINFVGVGECEAHDVTFIGTHSGVGFNGNNRNCRTRNVGGSDIVRAVFHINGGGNQHIALGTGFDNTGTAQACFLVEETERVDLDFGTASHHDVGLHIKPAANKTVQNVFSNFGDYDATAQRGVLIEATQNNSVVRNVFISGGSGGSASTQVGFEVKQSGTGQVGDIWLNNLMIQANLEEGLKLAAGRLHLTGVHVGNNGIVTGAPGIRLMAGLDFFQMVGGTSGQLLGSADKTVRPMLWENHQNYGIVLDSGFTGTALLDGVDLRNNLTGPIQNNSGTAILTVNNCLGYITRILGSTTITNGTKIKILPHSLGAAPRVSVATSNQVNSPYAISITADGSNLAVYTDVDTTSDVPVSYILER